MRIRFALTALLAFALLLWLLRSVDPADVWRHVAAADPLALIAGLVFVVLTFVARAIRWQYLLAPVGPTRFRTAFRTTIIGFAMLTLLPLRVGDLIRPYLLARQERLSVSATLATVAMERLLDLISVLILLALFLWTGGSGHVTPAAAVALTEVKFWASISTVSSLVVIIVMWALATHPLRAAALVRSVEHVSSPRIGEALARLVAYISAGFGSLRSPAAILSAVTWSLVIWLGIAGETWVVSRGFGIDMSFPGSFVMQPLLVLGVAVGTPGGLGPYQVAYVFGVTTFFGATQETAVASSFVVWTISFIPVVLWGLVYMAQDGLSLGRLEQLASEARKEPASTDEVSILRSSRR